MNTDIILEVITEFSSYILGFLSILIFVILPFKALLNKLTSIDEKFVPVQPLQENAYPIIDDLMKIINRECDKIFSVGYTYKGTKHAYSISHSTLNNPSQVITDTDVDNYTLQVSEKIIDNMSESFKLRLYSVIDPINFEDFIIEEIYYILFNRAIEINQDTMRN